MRVSNSVIISNLDGGVVEKNGCLCNHPMVAVACGLAQPTLEVSQPLVGHHHQTSHRAHTHVGTPPQPRG